MNNKSKDALSVRKLNHLSVRERVKKDHPGNMHLWWNRSPIDSSRELIQAVLSAEKDEKQTADFPTIVDPFSGYGGLVIAAADEGRHIVASDLNSVAVILTKAAAEIPARFADKPAVSSRAENRIYTDTLGLAEDVLCYGQGIRQELIRRMGEVYPESVDANAEGKKVYAWLWSRTVPCPNPACGRKIPLTTSYVLSKSKGREYYAQPEINGEEISFHVMQGVGEDLQSGNKVGNSGAKFRCPICGEITTDEYVKSMGKQHQLGIQMMAVGYEDTGEREYISPTNAQIISANIESCSAPPVGELPNNTRWFSPPLFGMKNYADLYTPRQVLLMETLCELVCEAREKIFVDAKKAGMPDDGISLSAGGSGALAYSEAVSVYLTLVVDKLANFQSEMCTWDNRKGNVRATFTRQAIPMTWMFAEGNPFSSVTGNFNTMLEDVVRSIRKLPCKASAKVSQGDATKTNFPKNSILFTELPYYDNVGYADLSDYFYVWMRRCLKDVYPALFERVVTSKEELTSIPEHYEGDACKAREAYEDGIHKLFMNFSEASSLEHPSIVFYEFGKADEKAMLSDLPKQSAWENILDALIQTGFQICAVLPVRTEKPNDRFATIRVGIVFKKRSEDLSQITRRGFVSELKRELPLMLREQFESEIDSWDLPVTGMGCGLSLFGKYKRIMNADGSNMSVHDALQVIWTSVLEYIRELELQDESSDIKEDNHAGEL